MAAASQLLPPASLPVQEEEEEKFHELISSLPKEDRFPLMPLYRYQNFWYPKRLLLGATAATQKATDDTEVIVASSPKAGTTWLKALTYAIINRSRFPPNLHQHPLLSNNPHQLVPFLEGFDSKHQNIPPSPIIAAHMPYSALSKSINDSNSKCKIIYICRDPKDVVVSLWHFLARWAENNGFIKASTTTAIPLQDVFELFCAGRSLVGPFWDHVREYWEASLEKPQKVLFLKYEELKRNPMGEMKGVAEFLGHGFTEEEEEQGVVEDVVKLCSFERLSNLEVNRKGAWDPGRLNITPIPIANKCFFRRGEVGDYRNHLTPQMAERLDRITQEKFQGILGLKFLNPSQ